MKWHESDERMMARYVDGGLQGPQLAAFERRLLAEPGLRQAVEQQRGVREWFGERRENEPVGAPSPQLKAAVLERTRRLPSRDELRAELGPFGEDDLAATEKLGQRLVVAAAVIFGLSMLVWGGLIKRADPQHLEASDKQAIEQIDAAIEADRLRRDAALGK